MSALSISNQDIRDRSRITMAVAVGGDFNDIKWVLIDRHSTFPSQSNHSGRIHKLRRPPYARRQRYNIMQPAFRTTPESFNNVTLCSSSPSANKLTTFLHPPFFCVYHICIVNQSLIRGKTEPSTQGRDPKHTFPLIFTSKAFPMRRRHRNIPSRPVTGLESQRRDNNSHCQALGIHTRLHKFLLSAEVLVTAHNGKRSRDGSNP